MRHWTILFLFILGMALFGCTQAPPSPDAKASTPTVAAEKVAPGRTLPLSVRLGDTVDVEYTLSVGGFVVETTNRAVAIQARLPQAETSNFTPLHFIVGYNKVIPSIEKTIQGMQEGQNKVVQVPPEQGFGEQKPELVKPYPKEVFGPQVQMGFLVFDSNQTPIGKVVQLNETHAWLDTNHPLAGKTLTLNLTVLRIQPPQVVGGIRNRTQSL